MQQPEGFESAEYPNSVCELKKSLYGLKQAPRCWSQKLCDVMSKRGLDQSQCDLSLFYGKINMSTMKNKCACVLGCLC